MDSTEICALTPDSIAELLASRQETRKQRHWHGRRNAQRWTFPSTVELWLPTEQGGKERYSLAEAVNLSTTGIGIRSDEPLTTDTNIGIAIHEPEVSFHGRAVVRHCTETEHGFCLVGLQFVFDEPCSNP